jgi:hypothetical protein
VGFWLFVAVVVRHLLPMDPAMIVPIVIFPAVGVAYFWAIARRDGQRVVEFTCDESSFRFRKVRSAQAETRALSEVAQVWEARERSGVTGYGVVFRDGHKVFLERSLPNAKAAADWLNSHRQP